MSTLIVIPARLGATRLPRKPLRLLGGAPLIVRVWERCAAMQAADRVVVATDVEEIAAVVRAAGGEAVITSDQHVSGTDRVAEVASHPDFAAYEVIVNYQGDEPYLSADAVRGAIAQVTSGRFPLGTAAAESTPTILDDPANVKVVTDDHGRALYFSRAPIPFLRDAADAAHQRPLVRQHLGIYAYRPDALRRWVALPPHPLELTERLEQLRALADGLAMGVAFVGPVEGGGIDTEEDLARANDRWTAPTVTPSR
ncbi:MAG: 3-deoxy-manno-octulosonate cytidylyltransferase [Gemmatimonadaceae bacterium]|nr:3-deoxy-manno-octulosonate cytidylyltransferase [Gemmatimonadaceae bacterium]